MLFTRRFCGAMKKRPMLRLRRHTSARRQSQIERGAEAINLLAAQVAVAADEAANGRVGHVGAAAEFAVCHPRVRDRGPQLLGYRHNVASKNIFPNRSGVA